MQPTNKKVIVLGSDHNGVELKGQAKALLQTMGFTCIDMGPHTDNLKVDYVDYATSVAHAVNEHEAERGILICGTGVGMSIVANRFSNVRASLVHSIDVARKTREHNDANVLCIGAWIVDQAENLNIVRTWIGEKFGEGRHVPRIEKTKNVTNSQALVFTNGIFDILHEGHLGLLKFAKSLGSKLIVGINSDRSVKIIKGPERPINGEKYRKEFLENLRFVDEVVIFDDVKTINLIRQVKPNILVKGGEWSADEVRQRDQIPEDIDIKIFPLVLNADEDGEKHSTTNIIKKIRGDYKSSTA